MFNPDHGVWLLPRGAHTIDCATWSDSDARLHEFVELELLRSNRDRDEWIDVVVALVPRADNDHNPRAISIAQPITYGGSHLDRHLGYVFDRDHRFVGGPRFHVLARWSADLRRDDPRRPGLSYPNVTLRQPLATGALMSRVRSYRRRDGTRVRGHQRTRRASISRPRRAPRVSRRRPAARATPDRSGWWLAAGLALVVALWLVTEFVRRHPIWSVVILVGLLAAGAGVLTLVRRAGRRRRSEEQTRALHVEVTDTMTGPQFEQWVAALLTRSGFAAVTVSGRAGDRGADIVATTPDNRRLVVQCKRHGPTNRAGSAAIQRFAGTCRSIHRGDICAIVTNGSFTAGDGRQLARELGIVLLDRTALAHWAYTGIPPASLGRG